MGSLDRRSVKEYFNPNEYSLILSKLAILNNHCLSQIYKIDLKQHRM